MLNKPKPKKPDMAPIKRKRPEALTQREQEILQLIWSGLKNKEIAQRLKISVKTVEAHRANMMKKAAERRDTGRVDPDQIAIRTYPFFASRCLTASNIVAATETETFSELICPCIGIYTRWSHFL